MNDTQHAKVETVDQYVLQSPDGRYIGKRRPGDRGPNVTPAPEVAVVWDTLGDARDAAEMWTRELADLGSGDCYRVLHRAVQVIKPHYLPAPEPAPADNINPF